MHTCLRKSRPAFTLLELVAVVTLLGIVSALVIVRYNSSDKDSVKKGACAVQKREIELQAQLYYRATGNWPSSTCGEMNSASYFPKGLPVCPVDSSAYEFNTVTHRVNGHSH